MPSGQRPSIHGPIADLSRPLPKFYGQRALGFVAYGEMLSHTSLSTARRTAVVSGLNMTPLPQPVDSEDNLSFFVLLSRKLLRLRNHVVRRTVLTDFGTMIAQVPSRCGTRSALIRPSDRPRTNRDIKHRASCSVPLRRHQGAMTTISTIDGAAYQTL